jgi:uncharacterized membrane protein HdeD (DUF308 family)
MPVILAKNWWSLVIRGVFAIVLGLITILWRTITFDFLIPAFFAYALIDGLIAMAGALRAAEEGERWDSLMIEALAGIAIAIAGAAWLATTALRFIYLIATWALVTGVFELVSAARLRRHVRGEMLLALSGVASLALAGLMFLLPLAGISAISLWIGAYALVFGALLSGLGLRLRRLIPDVSGMIPERHGSRPAVPRR